MPKLLRTLSFRTNNVRDFIFHRDAIYEKDVGTVKDANADGSGRTDALAGPAVSFGYETSDNTTRVAGVDRAYHVKVNETNVSGLRGLIVPTVTSTSTLSKAGYSFSGSSDIYLPTVQSLKAATGTGIDNTAGAGEFYSFVKDTLSSIANDSYFDRFEPLDEFIDIERIVYDPTDLLAQTSGDLGVTFGSGILYQKTVGGTLSHMFANGMTRLKFSLIAEDVQARPSLKYIEIAGSDLPASGTDVDAVKLRWTFSGNGIQLPSKNNNAVPANLKEIMTIDLPLIHTDGTPIKTGDTYEFYHGTATAAVTAGGFNNNNEFELNKFAGDGNYDNNGEINSITYNFGGGTVGSYDITDLVFYESAHWVVHDILEYRDEYIKLKCLKHRGSSPARRRAHG
jgi:hypothetical protein